MLHTTHYLFAMYQCIDTLGPSINPLSWVILCIIVMQQLGIEPQSSGLQLHSNKDLERLCHEAMSVTIGLPCIELAGVTMLSQPLHLILVLIALPTVC